MSWCPNCKFEYVDGIKICPDCKTALVDSLDESEILDSEPSFSDEEMAEALRPYIGDMPDEIERQEIYERMKKIAENPTYKSKEEQYTENRSGAGVLIVCGIIGFFVLVLNGLGKINIPLKGFSLILMNTVMGVLFFVFLVSGIMAVVKMKKLKPEIVEEKSKIDDIVNFIKANKADGTYKLDKEDDDYEALYLELSDKVVNDINEAFDNLEPGFAFYVVDRFASDILDED